MKPHLCHEISALRWKFVIIMKSHQSEENLSFSDVTLSNIHQLDENLIIMMKIGVTIMVKKHTCTVVDFW